jgi:uncharacterized protein (TIGR03437 family)
MLEILELAGRRLRMAARYVAIGVALWATASAHAAGLASILGGSGQDYAASVKTDAQGNTYVAGLTYSPDFKVTPGALQTKIGGGSDAFVAKFAPDGSLLWSTYLGGLADDWATGVAVDGSGNVIVCGWTRSSNFPVVHPFQATLNNGVSPARFDAFVAKLNPNGTQLIYSTYLGGPDDDGAYALALDAAGNAYVTGQVPVAAGFPGFKPVIGFGSFVTKIDPQGALVYSYFHPKTSFAGIGAAAGIAVDASGSAYVTGSVQLAYPSDPGHTFGPAGNTQAIVFKVSPDGSQRIYETALGGSLDTYGMGIAVDRTGAAYVAGITRSVDFPLVRPLQSNFGARSLWKSFDSGLTWSPLSDLPFAALEALVVDPTSTDTLYAATLDAGVFKSLDGGTTWALASKGIAGPQVHAIAIDALHPQTLFAVTPLGVVYRTTDGGTNWTAVDHAKDPGTFQVAVDPKNSANVYWTGAGATRKSTDGGATWSDLPFPGTAIQSFVLDPRVSGNIYASSVAVLLRPPQTSTLPYVYRSSNGGGAWTRSANSLLGLNPKMSIDGSTDPSTVYVDINSRSTDGGVTWSDLTAAPGPPGDLNAVAVDSVGTIYAAVSNRNDHLYLSFTHGDTWVPVGSPVPLPTSSYPFVNSVTGIVPARPSGPIYAIVTNNQSSGFVSKLSPDGASLVFSTFLNGHVSMASANIYAAEPGVFLTQNWASAIALDSQGNVVVAGGTRATDFATVNAVQSTNAGQADAFAATIAADGSKLLSSTYLGGSGDDGALAVTIDAQDNVVVAGQTWSLDFPVPGGVQPPAGLGEAFVVKLAPASPPVITSVVNGASFQPGIESGSWVTIRGTNLANTNPGRTWRADEIVNGSLPRSLDNVSVTINGKPAFVYYISPTQINVQAPTDATLGPVDVVVTNNGNVSALATAELQAAAPAFFQDPATSYAIATHLDNSLVGESAPARPGEIIVLWGTGFGATQPPTPDGSAVAGAPAVASPVTVSVGGQDAKVLSAVLTTGTAGLYQITIQLPGSLPAGLAPVQATTGGIQSRAGVQISIAR